MLFFIVFVLFSVLIFRLGVVQIVHGEDYQRKIERTENVTANTSVPRGKIFDRNNQTVVDNRSKYAITYTRSKNASPKEMLKTAKKLADLIHMDTDKVTERDKKDFWIMEHPKEAKKKITKEEWKKYKANKLSDDQLYKLQLKRVTKKDLASLTKHDLEVLAIYRQFNSGYAMTPQIVKNNGVTPKEYALVNENLHSLPGVDTTVDWDRSYAYGETLKSVLGKISSSNEGLPQDMLDYYLSKDYSRNDRVGKSYIEYQYEDILRGQKTKIKNITDKDGNILDSQVVSKGKRGDDLVLTIDMDLQKAVDQIISQELLKEIPGRSYLDRAFVTMMDPHTGEILAMAGKKYEINKKTGKPELVDFALGNMTTSYAMGSAVKGATLLTGYMTGAIHPGQYIVDEPLKFRGTNPKSSWFNRTGAMSINDLYALKRSSNVYMFKTAIAIGKGTYHPNQSLQIDMNAFNIMRSHYAQFGLGVPTGIDLPNEQVGYKGKIDPGQPGLLLDLAIGQFDTYTPLQMAQYVSTIANGGYRMQPHIVKEIREPVSEPNKIGSVVKIVEPKVLNRIDAKTSWIQHVQEGFREVMQDPQGTAYNAFHDAPYKPAGKTGTAEGVYDGPKSEEFLKKGRQLPMVWNLTLVGYAPYDHPEIAFSVVVPWVYEGNGSSQINYNIGRRILDKYFELKKERAKHQSSDVVVDTEPKQQMSEKDSQTNNGQ
jgi:cell division protein FtsI/penicillin-binding protein 2